MIVLGRDEYKLMSRFLTKMNLALWNKYRMDEYRTGILTSGMNKYFKLIAVVSRDKNLRFAGIRHKVTSPRSGAFKRGECLSTKGVLVKTWAEVTCPNCYSIRTDDAKLTKLGRE